ncbi:unnamed protein product, partial [Didymodactylos carnosus]
ANDISRVYLLDRDSPTNFLGCADGCYTFSNTKAADILPTIIHSAIPGNRIEKNGNIISTIIDINKGSVFGYNLNYQLRSSDDALITTLNFIPERMNGIDLDYVYGFEYKNFLFYVLKRIDYIPTDSGNQKSVLSIKTKLARLCSAPLVMRSSYSEITLNCTLEKFQTTTTTTEPKLAMFDHIQNQLYISYSSNHNDTAICLYSIQDIMNTFSRSFQECQQGKGYRLAHIVDSLDARPECEKLQTTVKTDSDECIWKPYETNLYMDGLITLSSGAVYYDDQNKINLLFVKSNVIVLGTSKGSLIKFIQQDNKIHLIHEAVYKNETINSQYVVDEQNQALIFAIQNELHHYSYNSCSLYDTCQSCIGSKKFDRNRCVWCDGRCTDEDHCSSKSMRNSGCPPTIEHINPTHVNINNEYVWLHLSGSFRQIKPQLVFVTVQFLSLTENESNVHCTIDKIEDNSLTCLLRVPRKTGDGSVIVTIIPDKAPVIGDTVISGSTQLKQKITVYVPKPLLSPNVGPFSGGTRIKIKNLDFNQPIETSQLKVYFNDNECNISQVTDAVECINRACYNKNTSSVNQKDGEELLLNIFLKGQKYQIEDTFFTCYEDAIVTDWYPKKAFVSGGVRLSVFGKNLHIIETPMMKFSQIDQNNSTGSNSSFLSICEHDRNETIVCHSPNVTELVNKNLILPLDLNISFILDNVPSPSNLSTLTIVNDPIYFPFETSPKLINIDTEKHLLIKGASLASTHSMDQLKIYMGDLNKTCIPLNLTETQLLCSLSKFIILTNEQIYDVMIRVGNNLTYNIGQILIRNQTAATIEEQKSLTEHYRSNSNQFSPWIVAALILLTSVTILLLIFGFVVYVRQKIRRNLTQHRPPAYYKTVWNELGKKLHVNSKSLRIGDKVGAGCFGDVYKGRLQTKSGNESVDVAVKVLRDQNVATIHDFLSEANRMKSFKHPNVLSLIGVCWDPIRKAMVILPYMINGDLHSYIIDEKNRPTVRQLIQWGIQVADGMTYLSELKFVHRDLATRNCMLDDHLICRISDFGLSRDVIDRDYYIIKNDDKDNSDKSVTKPLRRLPIRWLSPESIELSKYTIQSDVWSFGVLLWELLSRGKTPYTGVDNQDIYSYIRNGYRLPQPPYCPQLLYTSVMCRCWQWDPLQRPTFSQLAHEIRTILHTLEKRIDPQQQEKTSKLSFSSVHGEEAGELPKRISTDSYVSSNGGEYILTPRPESMQLLSDETKETLQEHYLEGNYDSTEMINADVFSTTRLLPRYVETSITDV